MGAELNAGTSKEYTMYYARFLDEHLPKAFEMLGDMVVNSLCAEEECERERKVVIEEIGRMEDNPEDLVDEIFESALWPDHPIGLPIIGTRETVGSFGHAAGGRVSAQALHHRKRRRGRGRQRRSRGARGALRALPRGPARRSRAPSRGSRVAGDAEPRRERRTRHRAGAHPSRRARRWTRATPTGIRSRSSATYSAEGCRRGCSRRSASSAGSPTPFRLPLASPGHRRVLRLRRHEPRQHRDRHQAHQVRVRRHRRQRRDHRGARPRARSPHPVTSCCPPRPRAPAWSGWDAPRSPTPRSCRPRTSSSVSTPSRMDDVRRVAQPCPGRADHARDRRPVRRGAGRGIRQAGAAD